ncbi:Flagellar hook-length control protein FliK [Bathymodiolus thermophilus thioautotrophic gill symbiont]|uniref:beta strand repeat-containing protein n=1 Tax=Bathymodiolus thermophilus thioautotrophic gill symbiont TaxID=2360 RepID=UPI0010B5BBE1|nr:FG-GAP-like repeat-containing protein [Bathymodiolus thermophilus thioautotrophic gill symbiont]SGZ76788.1 Flagellar hook-length control protein FliK [Bathymodiolus thermophilus thioautotrophic gill symbiont]
MSCLVSLPTEDGGLYHIVADAFFTLEDGTQVVYFYGEQSIVSTESGAVRTNGNQSFFDVVTSNIGIVSAVVVAAIVAVVSSSGSDNNDDDTPLTFTFADTGGFTSSVVITVSGVKEGETWQYSIDGGAYYTNGIGNSFTLVEGTHAANAIKIKLTDATGKVSEITNTSPIVVDTTAPSFISSTTVGVRTNTDASEVIYKAVATDNNIVTYALEDGNQKDKFTISERGELKYKQKQTTIHDDDKVTIIATDTAGNETKQLVTISVKDFVLSTTVAWDNIGGNDSINIEELAMATLGGTVTGININSIVITSITFKREGTDTTYTLDANLLPSINDDNTWTLVNNDTWTSQLENGNYIVTVKLSGNDGNVTGQEIVRAVTIDKIAPTMPTFDFTDTGLLGDGITKNGVITVGNLQSGITWQYSINHGTSFTNGEGSSFTLAEGTYVRKDIQVRQTDVVGNVSIASNIAPIVVDATSPVTPKLTFVNTGSLDDDITKDGVITVGDLESGITWQYSVDGGTNFTNGEGSSFTLVEGTYGANAIQIKQTDIAGNASDIVKIISPIVVDTTSPIFAQQSTTVDIFVNAPITTTVYNAQASVGDADRITYSIKNANTSKFSITDDTGIVTYKTIQTTVHNDDTFTIIATDIAGNATEQAVTVSVRPPATQGFVIDGQSIGQSVGTWNGWSVSSAGDVNGDGLDDLIVVDEVEGAAGKSYVVFGRTDKTTVSLLAIALGTSAGGFVMNGEAAVDKDGFSVSSAGDVNGDGLDDLIVGSPSAGAIASNAGKSYVVFGKANGAVVNLSVIASGMGGFVINGENTFDLSGSSVSSAGDVNGDGLDDLIVGADNASTVTSAYAGKSYVVFGKKGSTTAVNLSAIASGTGGFVINGENTFDLSGSSVSSAGDVNGDGLDDLIIGAKGARLTAGPLLTGKSYVVFGKMDNTTAVNLSAIVSGMGGFVINGENAQDYSGNSVSSAGDVNGDGLDDLIVGAHKADSASGSNAGKSYVVFGKKDNTAAVNLSTIASGVGGFVINGENANDKSGFSVSSAGDVNGDGLDDLVVGAYNPDGGSGTGKSYVVFGKTNGAAVNLSAIASDFGTGGFVINSESTNNKSGFSVSSAGDVNGDGLDDLIVGTVIEGVTSGIDAGKSYVVFGKTDTKAVNLADISKDEGAVAHAIDFQGDKREYIGTFADELFVAGLGDNILIGGGGTDVFNAGAGDDTIIINSNNLDKLYSSILGSHLLARVDGGGGSDTLKLAGSNLNLDLSQIDNGRIQDIEIIDLTGSGDNILKLNLNDLLDISSETNTLKVVGNSGDKVDIEVMVYAFVKDSMQTEGNITYDIYSNINAPTAELWIAQDLTVF